MVRELEVARDPAELFATSDQLCVVETDTGRVLGSCFDLRSLHDALALPEDTDVWRRLAASAAYPAAVAGLTPDQVREAIANPWGARDRRR